LSTLCVHGSHANATFLARRTGNFASLRNTRVCLQNAENISTVAAYHWLSVRRSPWSRIGIQPSNWARFGNLHNSISQRTSDMPRKTNAWAMARVDAFDNHLAWKLSLLPCDRGDPVKTRHAWPRGQLGLILVNSSQRGVLATAPASHSRTHMLFHHGGRNGRSTPKCFF